MNKYVVIFDTINPRKFILLKYTKEKRLDRRTMNKLLLSRDRAAGYLARVFSKNNKYYFLLEDLDTVYNNQIDINIIKADNDGYFWETLPGKVFVDKEYFFKADDDESAKLICEIGGYE